MTMDEPKVCEHKHIIITIRVKGRTIQTMCGDCDEVFQRYGDTPMNNKPKTNEEIIRQAGMLIPNPLSIASYLEEKEITRKESTINTMLNEARRSAIEEAIAKLKKLSETMELWQEAYGTTDVTMIIVRTTLERAIALLEKMNA